MPDDNLSPSLSSEEDAIMSDEQVGRRLLPRWMIWRTCGDSSQHRELSSLSGSRHVCMVLESYMMRMGFS